MTDNSKQDKCNNEENMEQAASFADAEDCICTEPIDEDFDSEAEALKAAIEAGDFDVKEYLKEYKEAMAATEELNERMTRLQADFENFRRRSRKDAEEAGKRAQGELIASILPIIDNFERALAAMSESADKEGVAMIDKQLHDVLATAGLSEIDCLMADFDPNIHHSVARLETEDAQKGKVLAVLQKGYMFDGKLLRAPLVQVGV